MIVYNGYETHTSYNCMLGCIENYLKYYGVNVSDTDLFFACDGFELHYDNKEDEEDNLYIRNDYVSVLSEMGISCRWDYVKNKKEELKDILICLVKRETPIIISLDTGKLTYESVFVRNKPTDHCFNLIGYDLDKDMFCISDSFIPANIPYSKQLWLDAAEIIEAWNENRQIMILSGFNKCIDYEVDIQKSVQNQLIKYMTGKKTKDSYEGKDAIKEYIKDMKKKIHRDNMVPSVIEMNYQLRVKGFYTAREYLLSFYKSYGYKTEEEKMMELLEEWKKSGLIMIKNAFSGKCDFISTKLDYFLSLCECEEKLFAKTIDKLEMI